MLLKRVSLYTFSIYFSTLIAIIQGIIIAKLLSPYFMGYFSQIKIILSYLPLINFGFINGLLIVLPSADENDKKMYITNAVFISFLLYIFIALLLLVFFYLSNNRIFLYSALIFPVFGIKDLPVFSMRGENKFVSLSKYYFFSSIINIFIIILFIYYYKFTGALVGLFLSSFVNLLLGMYLGKIKLLYNISLNKIKELQDKGKHIYFVYFFNFLKDIGEKFVIMFVVDKIQYAFYTIGIVIVSFFDIIPSTIFQFFLPDFIVNPAKWNNKKMRTMIMFVIYIMVNLILIGMMIFTYFIPKFLPKYKASLNIFYILSFTGILNVFNFIIYNKLISLKKAIFLYLSQISSFVIILISIILIRIFTENINLNIIAFIILITRIVYSKMLLLLIYKFLSIKLINGFMLFYFIFIISIIFLSIVCIKAGQTYMIFILQILFLLFFSKRFIKWKNQLTL